MTPLVKMTEAIGGQKWVTITSVRPLIYKLLSVDLVPTEGEHRLKKVMKRLMREKLLEYYGDEAHLALLNKATVLDPRFKNAPFVSTDGLVEEMVNIITTSSSTTPTLSTSTAITTSITTTTSSNFSQPKRPKSQLMELIGDIIQSPSVVSNPIEIAHQELQRYLADLVHPDHLHPLSWWFDNVKRYPTLAIMARKYLCICATSVPSERAFSLAGHIVNERRASLLPETVNMLSFLADNLP